MKEMRNSCLITSWIFILVIWLKKTKTYFNYPCFNYICKNICIIFLIKKKKLQLYFICQGSIFHFPFI